MHKSKKAANHHVQVKNAANQSPGFSPETRYCRNWLLMFSPIVCQDDVGELPTALYCTMKNRIGRPSLSGTDQRTSTVVSDSRSTTGAVGGTSFAVAANENKPEREGYTECTAWRHVLSTAAQCCIQQLIAANRYLPLCNAAQRSSPLSTAVHG